MTLVETVHRLDMSFAGHDPGVDAVCRTPSTCERAMERGAMGDALVGEFASSYRSLKS